MRQLHDKMVFIPMHAHNLNQRQKKEALCALMFLKQKQTGNIKGHNCADGRPYGKTAKKGAASAPTAQIELVLITTCINAMENRDVAIEDTPGEFLKAHMEKDFHMLLYGDMDEAMRHI